MALERGKLADQIFFDPGRASHRFFGALINAFLKSPPLKQLLAIEKLKSRFLGRLAESAVRDLDRKVQAIRSNPVPTDRAGTQG